MRFSRDALSIERANTSSAMACGITTTPSTSPKTVSPVEPQHGQPVAHAATQAAETLSSRYQRITVVGERQTEGAALEAV